MAIIASDRAAHAACVSEHYAFLTRYLHFIGCQRDRVEDVCHDAFVEVLHRGVRDLGSAAMRAYLRQAARHRWLALARVDARDAAALAALAREVDAHDAAFDRFAAGDGGTDLLAALHACLAELGARAVDALRCRYGDGLALEAVAARLGLKVSGVDSLLVRARASLRGCIEARLQRGPSSRRSE